MQNDYFFNPYLNEGISYYRCPVSQNIFSYCQSMCRGLYEDEQLDYEDLDEDYNYQDLDEEIEAYTLEDNYRAQSDIDRVIKLINRESQNQINELERIGIDKRLISYIIKTMVTYIDKNYNKYKGTFEQKVEIAVRDIRKDLHWIFEILQVFSASPATIARLTDIVVRTSLKKLRPENPIQPPGPMPRE